MRSGSLIHLSPVWFSSLSRKRSRQSTHRTQKTLPIPLLVLSPSLTFNARTRISAKRFVVARKYHVWCSSSIRLLDIRLSRCKNRHTTENPANSVYARVRGLWPGLRVKCSSLLKMFIIPGARKEIAITPRKRQRKPTKFTLARRLVWRRVRFWNALSRFKTREVIFSLSIDIWAQVGWGIGISAEHIRTKTSMSVWRAFRLITKEKNWLRST